MKCIAPRYASPVRGGGIRKHTSHTHTTYSAPPPYTLHAHDLHTPYPQKARKLERGHPANLSLGPKF